MTLTLLHSERPKLHTILAFLSAIGLIPVLYSQTVENILMFSLRLMDTLLGKVTVEFSFLPSFSGGGGGKGRGFSSLRLEEKGFLPQEQCFSLKSQLH